MPTKTNSRRRGPSAGVSGGVLAEPISFPVKGPKAREIKPEECVVRVIAACEDGVRVVVLPKESAVRDILNEAYGPLGWGDSYYYTKNWWRCQLEVLSPVNGLPVRKDAGPMCMPSADVDRMQENTSFLRAAALFGVAEDVMDLKPIALKSEQVPVVKDQHGVWRAAEKLTVDRFARAEDGHIHMVQFALASGKKVLWDEATL